jgi:hypothetical protein
MIHARIYAKLEPNQRHPTLFAYKLQSNMYTLSRDSPNTKALLALGLETTYVSDNYR